jgi:hypothetical protein
MLELTINAVGAVLKTDTSVTALDRNQFLAQLRAGPKSAKPREQRSKKIIRPGEAAKMVSRSTKFMHRLARQGVLSKVYAPGKKRALGFRLADVEELIAGSYERGG